MTEADYKSQSEPTKYIPYLTLRGQVWDVFCEDLRENWPCYNSTALYCLQYVNGLEQERCNSIANALEFVFLALTH